jgi:DNA-binding response OmpR family regulator
MNQRRVMLVDDCLDNHELIREALAGEFEVFGLADPLRFKDAFEVAQPDLLILDLLMPRRSGFDILDELNVMKGKADRLPLPVIVLSAKRSVENHKRAYALGAVLYLNKPFEPERLLRNIKMLMDSTKLPPMKPKAYKLHEIEKQMDLRKSFQHSRIVLETDARKAAQPATTARKVPGSAAASQRAGVDEDEEHPHPSWVG